MRRAGCLALLALAAHAAAAEEPAGPRLRYDLAVDGTVALSAAAAWGLSEAFLKPIAAPQTCRICGTNPIDDGARSLLVWQDTALANGASNLLAYVLVPAAAIGEAALSARPGGARERAGDVVLIAEAVALSGDVGQLVKFLAGRERPYMQARSPAERLALRDPDDDLSFYSGHTAFTFAIASAAGTIARLRGDPAWPAVYATGFAAGALVGYLRIAADRHYLSDVVTGALVGAAIGFAAPWFFHRDTTAPPGGGVVIAPGGIAFAF